jgi:hypothetical protein
MKSLALAALLFVAAGGAVPKKVKLYKGKSYRFTLHLLNSSVPLTPELIAGIKQGLEASGMRDITIQLQQGKAIAQYTQLQQKDAEVTLNAEVPMSMGGITITLKIVKVVELASAGV